MAERSSSISELGEVAASPAGIHSSLYSTILSYPSLIHPAYSIAISSSSINPCLFAPSIPCTLLSLILPYIHLSVLPPSFFISIYSSTIPSFLIYMHPFFHHPSIYTSLLSISSLPNIHLFYFPPSLNIFNYCSFHYLSYIHVFFIHPSLSTSCLLPSILLLFYLFCLLFILFYRFPLSIILPYIHLSFLHLSFHHPSIYPPLLSPFLPLSVYPSFKHSVYLSYIHVFSFLPS